MFDLEGACFNEIHYGREGSIAQKNTYEREGGTQIRATPYAHFKRDLTQPSSMSMVTGMVTVIVTVTITSLFFY